MGFNLAFKALMMYLHCNYLYFIAECCINLYFMFYVNMLGTSL